MKVAALGGSAEIAGYGLAGVLLYPSEDAQQARLAWQAMPADVGLVILTHAAAQALDLSGSDRLVAVMPQ